MLYASIYIAGHQKCYCCDTGRHVCLRFSFFGEICVLRAFADAFEAAGTKVPDIQSEVKTCSPVCIAALITIMGDARVK